MARVLLVAGTHGYLEEWYRQGSPFARMLEAAGHTLAEPNEAFAWTARLEGVVGDDREWEVWGQALAHYLQLYDVDAIIAHSHGGNMAVHGLARLPLGRYRNPATFITVATPVRPDLSEVYKAARQRLERWRHIRSGRTDAWQRWGTLPWRDLWRMLVTLDFTLERDMAFADGNIYVPGVSHAGLLEPDLWVTRKWAEWITPPTKELPPPTAPTPPVALAV